MPIFNLESFGAKGDRTTDDVAAIEKCLGSMQHGDRLELTGGKKYRYSRKLVLTKDVEIVGGGDSLAGFSGLYPDPNIVGLEIGQQGAYLRGVGIYSRPAPIGTPRDPNAHGVVASWKIIWDDCRVDSFPGDGIHIESPAPMYPGGNANAWRLMGGYITACGGNGILTRGGDSNAGTALGVAISLCGGWAVSDESFLGNMWLGCTAHTNGNPLPGKVGTAFRAGLTNNPRSVFLGCYQEEDNASVIDGRSLWIGMGATTGTGGIYLLEGGGLRFVNQIRGKRMAAESIEFGAKGKTPFIIGQFAGSDDFALYHASKPSQPLLLLDVIDELLPDGRMVQSAALGLPWKHYVGTGPSKYKVDHLPVPPTSTDPLKPEWGYKDRVINSAPRPGTPERWLCTARDVAGKLTWKAVGMIEL